MSKEYTEYLEELLSKGSASVVAFLYRRGLLLLFSYLITSLSSASTYGYISVLIRTQSTYTRLLKYSFSANTRTLPRLNSDEFHDLARVALILGFIIFTTASAVIYLSWSYILSKTVLNQSHNTLAIAVILSMLSGTVLFYCSSIYKSKIKIRKSLVFSQIITPSCLVLSALIARIFFRTRTVDVWLIFTILMLFFSVISLVVISLEVDFSAKIDAKLETVKGYLSYMSYAGVSGIFILSHRDIVFVLMAVFLSAVSAGLFSLCLILAKISRWALSGINQVFPAIASSLYDNDDNDKIDKLYKSTSKIATTISSIPFMFASAYHPQILGLFSPQYTGNSQILVIALGSQVIATVAGSVGLLLMMTDNQKVSLYISISNSLIMIPLSIFLVTNYGVVGLAFSFLFTMTYNNIAEMVALYYYENLFSLTVEHIYILAISVAISVINILIKSQLPEIIELPLCILTSTSILLVSYRYLFTEAEREAIISVAPFSL